MSGFCGNPECSGACSAGYCGADCDGRCAPGSPRSYVAADDPRKCPGCGATRMHELDACICGYVPKARRAAPLTPEDAYRRLAERVGGL
jgi:hypothetical protein